ncbi:hypothetical protein ELB75_06085 [Eikenella corrodens]|uniref:Uncharacterized protein n=1 Tax=Eikenella corrodens TaxID=539 RepID=A0A3S9SMN9_EIKCO|nr:hypothetical protein ELB75_06085 [Eikenella corrodens]
MSTINKRLGILFQAVCFYSELNLNQYSVVSPCRNVCTVCSSPPCPDLNLIHYIYRVSASLPAIQAKAT